MNSLAVLRISALSLAIVAGSPMTVLAQAEQQEMSVEELEKYIEKQKAALAEVEANRDETESKAREVRDALAEQEARRERVREELEALCKEQDAIDPGSYEDCADVTDS